MVGEGRVQGRTKARPFSRRCRCFLFCSLSQSEVTFLISVLLPFSARLPVGQKMRKLFGVWFNTLPEEWPHAEFDFGDVTNKQCQELEMFYLNHCKQSFGGECDHFWQIAEVALEDRIYKRKKLGSSNPI